MEFSGSSRRRSLRRKTREIAEFGDFQTPARLAKRVCRLLADRGIRPASVLEPTCGVGTFLSASLEAFASIRKAIGIEVNPRYVQRATGVFADGPNSSKVQIVHGDFFDTNFGELVSQLPEPLLVIGNPPWITNSELGALGSSNLPEKRNFQGHAGLDAMTGKSNFDISEW